MKPRVFQDEGIRVTIRQTYDLMIDDTFEVILPNYAKNVVILSGYILVILDDLIGNMCLFKRQENDWLFVTVLESFPHQSLINRRLNHVYLEVNNIAFVYNNRLRKYNLDTGKMIVNQQVLNARGKEYLGDDITKKNYWKSGSSGLMSELKWGELLPAEFENWPCSKHGYAISICCFYVVYGRQRSVYTLSGKSI